MGQRRLARERALQILYAVELTGYALTDVIVDYLEFRSELENNPKPLEQFTFDLVEKYLEEAEAVDQRLRDALINWKLERLSYMDRNILRLATTELLHFNDIPPRVTINEYIEVAKYFGDEESPNFVNGVLDRIARAENYDLNNTREKVRVSE